MRKKIIASVIAMVTSLGGSQASGLARYECKGITSDTIVLTPYQDGSVNLSFNKGPVEATTKFAHHGDVFVAEFKDFGTQHMLYIVILDTLTKNGYEFVDLPNRTPAATKMTCWWYQN